MTTPSEAARQQYSDNQPFSSPEPTVSARASGASSADINAPISKVAADGSGPGKQSPAAVSSTDAVRRRTTHYAGLVLASMLGCLIRLGLDAMGSYDGQVIFELAWAQGVGCGIMGLALWRKDEINAFYPSLYTFITTGVAGSVTSFSAWMLAGYQAFSNQAGYARSGFYSTVDGFAYSFATMALSMGCLYWGEHVSRCLPSFAEIRHRFHRASPTHTADKLPTSTPLSSREEPSSPEGSRSELPLDPHIERVIDYLVILSAVLSYLVALLIYFLGPSSWRHKATFPILLSPPGAILRFYLANLNTKPPFSGRFPIGTFIANIAGTLIVGGAFAAEYLPSSQGSPTRCSALWAIQQGFCGCLTTVSTFVVECRSIKGKRWTWLYVGSSVILGHLAILITFGAANWAGQLGGTLCSA